jgi:hypothetical protein
MNTYIQPKIEIVNMIASRCEALLQFRTQNQIAEALYTQEGIRILLQFIEPEEALPIAKALKIPPPPPCPRTRKAVLDLLTEELPRIKNCKDAKSFCPIAGRLAHLLFLLDDKRTLARIQKSDRIEDVPLIIDILCDAYGLKLPKERVITDELLLNTALRIQKRLDFVRGEQEKTCVLESLQMMVSYLSPPFQTPFQSVLADYPLTSKEPTKEEFLKEMEKEIHQLFANKKEEERVRIALAKILLLVELLGDEKTSEQISLIFKKPDFNLVEIIALICQAYPSTVPQTSVFLDVDDIEFFITSLIQKMGADPTLQKETKSLLSILFAFVPKERRGALVNKQLPLSFDPLPIPERPLQREVILQEMAKEIVPLWDLSDRKEMAKGLYRLSIYLTILEPMDNTLNLEDNTSFFSPLVAVCKKFGFPCPLEG